MKRQKRVQPMVIILTCAVTIAAVAVILQLNQSKISAEVPTQTQEEPLESWEADLLISAYNPSDSVREKLESGAMDAMPEETSMLRGAERYLQEKYPEVALRFTTIIPPFLMQQATIYSFTDADGEALFGCMTMGDGTYSDDYYSTIVRDGYDSSVAATLAASGIPVVAVRTEFTSFQGDNVNADTSADDLLTGSQRTIPRDTAIYILADEDSTYLPETAKVIELRDIYGAYRVYSSKLFTKDMSWEDCWNLWSSTWRTDTDAVIKVQFSNFHHGIEYAASE